MPWMQWWPDVTKRTLRMDAMAGVIGAVVVVPQGVAFATIAGMPPEYGLYAAIVPAIIAALFGSSRHLVSGPTTAASIVMFSILSTLAEPGSETYVLYALTLTFIVGVTQLLMGLARLGTLVNFVSHSVIIGFTAGAALLIATNQVKHFLGIDIPPGQSFHQNLLSLFAELPNVHLDTMVVGVSTLIVGIVTKQFIPRWYLIIALFVGSLIAALINFLTDIGFLHTQLHASGIQLVGAIPATLPPLSSPDFTFNTFRELAPAALAVTLFALTEAVSISRSFAARTGDLIDGNQEFIGQGLSNIVGSFFSAYVATGSFNRSAINFQAGARTPIAAIFAALLLAVIVVILAPLLAYLPNTATAAILFLVAWGLVDRRYIRMILRASRPDSLVMGTTFLATLMLDLDFAILFGVMLSLVIYLRKASTPAVVVRVPDPREPRRRFTTDARLPQCPQSVIVRIDGPIFFGAVNHVAQRLRQIARRNPAQRYLLILAQEISFLDLSGAEMLAREARLRRASGGQLYLHQLKDEPKRILSRGGYLNDIGTEHLYETKGEAIADMFKVMDKEICRRCEARIFNECRSLPKVGDARSEPVERTAVSAGSPPG